MSFHLTWIIDTNALDSFVPWIEPFNITFCETAYISARAVDICQLLHDVSVLWWWQTQSSSSSSFSLSLNLRPRQQWTLACQPRYNLPVAIDTWRVTVNVNKPLAASSNPGPSIGHCGWPTSTVMLQIAMESVVLAAYRSVNVNHSLLSSDCRSYRSR